MSRSVADRNIISNFGTRKSLIFVACPAIPITSTQFRIFVEIIFWNNAYTNNIAHSVKKTTRIWDS